MDGGSSDRCRCVVQKSILMSCGAKSDRCRRHCLKESVGISNSYGHVSWLNARISASDYLPQGSSVRIARNVYIAGDAKLSVGRDQPAKAKSCPRLSTSTRIRILCWPVINGTLHEQQNINELHHILHRIGGVTLISR